MKKPLYPVEWDAKAPRLTTIAKWLNENTSLFVEIVEGYCNTDRQIAGTRLRRPGKGRTGNRLKVFVCEEHKMELTVNPWHHFNKEDSVRERSRKYPRGPLLDHNAAETYRSNDEVVRWVKTYLTENPHVRTAVKQETSADSASDRCRFSACPTKSPS